MVKALAASLMALACVGVLPAQAACRLALVLALDVSSSVDAEEYRLQQHGVTGALSDSAIRAAILQGAAAAPVALAVYEWSGKRQNALVLDWLMLRTEADIDIAVRKIAAFPRSQTRFPTAMGFALGFGATLLRRAPACSRKVIDLSGDGITNDGFGPALAYKHFPFEGVTVNGLAVLGADPMVEDYFRDEVAHGADAFVETADGYAGYRRAMTRKLFREIGTMAVGQAGDRAQAPG